jgi:putative sugar O-methyltransferase
MSREEYLQYVDENALAEGLQPMPEAATPGDLQPLVERLCGLYRDLKGAQAQQAQIYRPGGEWADYLREREGAYRAWLSGDIRAATAGLQNFWRNELGDIVKQYATFQKLAESDQERRRFAGLMAHDFMIWKNLLGAPARELAVPAVGNPWGYRLEGVTIAPKALRYHVLADQIRGITAGCERPVIAEIGAGYGGTAHFLLRGTEPLCFIDFDLPEVLVLAAYYLQRTLPHRKVLLYEPGLEIGPGLIRDYDVILMPNWALPQLPQASVDLFLNTFSLSEMPYEVIAEYLRHVERACRGYFLHNNMDRPGVFNRGHERVPCSQYPISPAKFKVLYKRYDLFQQLHAGRDGDYREVLLQRIGNTARTPDGDDRVD